MSVPLLMTKLYIPSPGRYLVGRARLVEKLNGCLEPGCRLTLVSAPAGFGKTTLISEWIEAVKSSALDQKVAWLSLDEGDNDPVIFWTYVIAALQTLYLDIGQQALEVLATPGGELNRKLASLINDLSRISHQCALVLDDYHLIRSPIIHQSLGFFIEHTPPHIHLLIASRTDPPLPLALMRGRGQLLEIRLNDLRFSDEDAGAYLNAGIGLNLAAQSVQALNQKTEGWIAGLQMAALALQDITRRGSSPQTVTQASVSDFLASFSGSNRFILDYLIEEVLNRQTEPVQQFLIRTSILDQLCAPLCAALLQAGAKTADLEAESALRYLESSNLFIVPMDQQRYWYRYHHLFADLLRKRLAQVAPELIPELHDRAIRWYEQNGLVPSAIQHAFHLQDYHKAAALVAQITEELWGRGEHATLLSWMDALPQDEKANYPHMLTFQVSMLISAGKLQEAEACIPILERHIKASEESNPDQSALIGKISALRTYIASFHNDQPAIFAHGQTALQNLLRDEDAGQRCGISLILGHAYLVDGNLEAATQIFEEAIANAKKARKPSMIFAGFANLVEALWLQGSLNRGAQACQEALQLAQQYRIERSPMVADIMLGWGDVLCERGALVDAERYIHKGLEIAQEQQYIWQIARGYQAQSRLLLSHGNLAGAETAALAAEQWGETHDIPAYITCQAAGLLAGLWLRQRKTEQVERLLQARQVQFDKAIHYPHQAEYLVLATLAWMQGNDEAAGQILDRIIRWAESQHQTRILLEALLLQARVNRSQGDHQAALTFLARALELAEPEGYLQCFVNEGEPMALLLQQAVEQNIHPEYAARLLAAFPVTPVAEGIESQSLSESRYPGRTISEPTPLVEPLSKREMETLQLIAEGYSNKEIAQKLCISLRTVKYYSTGIYNKLGVDSRMQAVNRARELGLL